MACTGTLTLVSELVVGRHDLAADANDDQRVGQEARGKVADQLLLRLLHPDALAGLPVHGNDDVGRRELRVNDRGPEVVARDCDVLA